MDVDAARLQLKTRYFTVVVVLSGLFGNFSLSWGVRHLGQAGQLMSFSPLVYLRAIFNPWIALGISLLIVWLLSHMAILSWADLSYVLPVTSIGYVLTAFLGKLFLHEDISTWRWAGILLIMVGVCIVGRTAPHTSAEVISAPPVRAALRSAPYTSGEAISAQPVRAGLRGAPYTSGEAQ